LYLCSTNRLGSWDTRQRKQNQATKERQTRIRFDAEVFSCANTDLKQCCLDDGTHRCWSDQGEQRKYFRFSFGINWFFGWYQNKRISFNSGVKEIENKQCNLLVPTSSLIPSNKWLNLQIDCSSFLEASSSSSASSGEFCLKDKNNKSYLYYLGNRFKSLEAIIISAPCRIRRIFTSKSLLGTKKP